MLDGTVIVKQLHSFIQEHEICVQRNLELQQEVDDLNYMVENLKLERDYTRTKYRRLKAHLDRIKGGPPSLKRHHRDSESDTESVLEEVERQRSPSSVESDEDNNEEEEEEDVVMPPNPESAIPRTENDIAQDIAENLLNVSNERTDHNRRAEEGIIRAGVQELLMLPKWTTSRVDKEKRTLKRHGKECKENGSTCGKSAEDCPFKRRSKKAKPCEIVASNQSNKDSVATTSQ